MQNTSKYASGFATSDLFYSDIHALRLVSRTLHILSLLVEKYLIAHITAYWVYNISMKQVAEIVQETFSTRRMENLTDGVFAISMTLLILIIGISQLGDASSSTELYAAIYEKLPAVFGLIVGFLLLGSM